MYYPNNGCGDCLFITNRLPILTHSLYSAIFPAFHNQSGRRSSAVEHLFCKQAAAGSNPAAGSTYGPVFDGTIGGAETESIMSQDNLIKLECTACKSLNYHSTKNKKTLKNRLELMKFCKKCKKRVMHKETK